MTTIEFEELLKKAQLTKKEFAKLVKMHYTSVTNWKQDKKNIPEWVREYLNLYITLKEHENIGNSNKKVIDIGDNIKIDKEEYQELIQLKQIIKKIAS